MLLDDLLEACIIELSELGEVMHVGDDIAQVLLEQFEVPLRRRVLPGRAMAIVYLCNNLVDLLLGCCNAADDLFRFHLLESVHLVEL